MRALAGLRSLGGSKSQSLDDSVLSAQRKSLVEAAFITASDNKAPSSILSC